MNRNRWCVPARYRRPGWPRWVRARYWSYRGGWRLAAGGGGTLEDVVGGPTGPVELAAGQVRVAVAAVGVNFRDVLVALGMYPGGGEFGAEGAGGPSS